jgi:hypothetical protein
MNGWMDANFFILESLKSVQRTWIRGGVTWSSPWHSDGPQLKSCFFQSLLLYRANSPTTNYSYRTKGYYNQRFALFQNSFFCGRVWKAQLACSLAWSDRLLPFVWCDTAGHPLMSGISILAHIHWKGLVENSSMVVYCHLLNSNKLIQLRSFIHRRPSSSLKSVCPTELNHLPL